MPTTTLKMPTKSAKKKPKKKPGKVEWKKKTLASAFFFLAGGVLSVSLPHLAEGMRETLGVPMFASIVLAILFDLSQIAAEAYLLLLAQESGEKAVAKGVVVSATAVSIAYNGMAFLSHANGFFGVAVALLLAVLLPVGVLALSYLGSRVMFK